MSTFFFTESHECYRLEDGVAVISISEYAVEQLGEITYVQLPAAGQNYAKGASFGEVESVKTVSELYAPVAGTVVEVNAELEANPELVNEDPLGKGWMLKIKPEGSPEPGMTREAYDAYLEGLR